MANLRLEFFSLTLTSKIQGELFSVEEEGQDPASSSSRPENLMRMLEEAAGASVDRLVDGDISEPESQVASQTWQILDLAAIESGSLFQLGRVSKRTLPGVDAGFPPRFTREAQNIHPYTWAALFPDLGLLVIAEQNELSKTKTAANRLAELLRDTPEYRRSKMVLKVKPVKDATDMVEQVRKAHRILKVRLIVGRPNPPRTDVLIAQPLKVATEALGAGEGQAEFSGGAIRAETLLDLINDTSTGTGEDVQVKLEEVAGARPRWLHLREEPNLAKNVELPPEDSEEAYAGIMEDALAMFEHVVSLSQKS
ncbi:MAG: hypothetical protein EON58_01110 [Alphaproteobacteria bacterium]|nr:MAG: hypothetical protein EON58_01110 [Alphaproteobacteria bacterium]